MAVSRAGGAASCAEKYRALRRTVPDDVKTAELEDIEEWLGETVRQVDSSLLDEWEALSDPEAIERAAAAASASGDVVPPHGRSPATRAPSGSWCATRSFGASSCSRATTSRRWAPWRRPRTRAPGARQWTPPPGKTRWAPIGTSTTRSTRGPQAARRDCWPSTTPAALWRVRQTVEDPEGNHDFAIVAVVDLDASDAAGEPDIRTESFAAGG
jgi:hypothetical protein